MLDLKKEIKLAFAENKLAIGVSVAILLISLILGYFLEPYLHSILDPVVDAFSKQVKSGNIQLTFQSIFSNNIRIVFLMFIFGLLFCFSALILAFNGFFVGYFTATTGNLFNTVLLLIPHGIFEFSSCILACSSGFVLFRFAYNLIKTWFGEENKSFYTSYVENFDKLKQAILLLMVSAILMAIAGFIEVYLTIPIADFVSSIFT
ncbi:MAG: stage II sporulation protein M [Methanobrevibacter sp.]|uniref:stage II sporulation protein M n=1 Tax=Methanobrevibacter sp. TaxID=66852 RepID=UPI0026007ACB|nr:stage II sporulation protein M [Methanobrevibacter sp.]MBQ8016689.1 stage II sporulation protein M [Methanobrevibacter sp.]MBR1610234.1 stage II sporulation protein M [Methanobrevibacter sp.]